jgi:hypothetical protein
MNIQSAFLDQITVYRGIEVGVVRDIIDVTVDIVVHPSGGNRIKQPVIVAMDGSGYSH